MANAFDAWLWLRDGNRFCRKIKDMRLPARHYQADDGLAVPAPEEEISSQG